MKTYIIIENKDDLDCIKAKLENLKKNIISESAKFFSFCVMTVDLDFNDTKEIEINEFDENQIYIESDICINKIDENIANIISKIVSLEKTFFFSKKIRISMESIK